MTAVHADYPSQHKEFVLRHKVNFRRHAGAVLAGLKEFKEIADCGPQWTETNTNLVSAWSQSLGITDNDALQTLCDKIDKGEATPELDQIVGLYVCRLTGKMPDGSRVNLL